MGTGLEACGLQSASILWETSAVARRMFTDNKLAISLSSHMVTGNPWISAWVQHRIQIRFCLCGSIKFPIKLYNNTLSEVSFYAETPCTGRSTRCRCRGQQRCDVTLHPVHIILALTQPTLDCTHWSAAGLITPNLVNTPTATTTMPPAIKI